MYGVWKGTSHLFAAVLKQRCVRAGGVLHPPWTARTALASHFLVTLWLWQQPLRTRMKGVTRCNVCVLRARLVTQQAMWCVAHTPHTTLSQLALLEQPIGTVWEVATCRTWAAATRVANSKVAPHVYMSIASAHFGT
jgi:hypothetical protein